MFCTSHHIIRVIKFINLINEMKKRGTFFWSCCHHVGVAINIMDMHDDLSL
jgi:hypothetical protein